MKKGVVLVAHLTKMFLIFPPENNERFTSLPSPTYLHIIFVSIVQIISKTLKHKTYCNTFLTAIYIILRLITVHIATAVEYFVFLTSPKILVFIFNNLFTHFLYCYDFLINPVINCGDLNLYGYCEFIIRLINNKKAVNEDRIFCFVLIMAW